ncbi:unnamed protein product [Nippostrongylus brasiliensis]|uniref:Uncharacterized protein n=1 Tax=Nippostrongylus brasiliensis TaxID=27835 RepID=A0A0N4XTQ6_NIPBR|nr:unnamed protein product [Nippostrongylus brasiliensis]
MTSPRPKGQPWSALEVSRIGAMAELTSGGPHDLCANGLGCDRLRTTKNSWNLQGNIITKIWCPIDGYGLEEDI